MTTFPADPEYRLGPATILRGDARRLPLADESVDLIVTSPPYFALRSYQDGGEHYGGQIGSEQTPREFVDALIECTREMVRVLKPTGSIFVNLGDSYASSGGAGRQGGGGQMSDRGIAKARLTQTADRSIPAKSLRGLPWRYALRCIDDLGLILRAEVIWSKPNGLPESVTDRVRRSHEQWFHFVKQPRYFSAIDEIREPHGRSWGGSPNGGHTYAAMKAPGEKDSNLVAATPNPLGKLPGSVREVASQPLKVPPELGVDHFAAFPPAWPSWIIRGWSPSGICVECGEGRCPVVDVRNEPTQATNNAAKWSTVEIAEGNGRHRRPIRTASSTAITGYACACPTPDAPTRPATVLDPFGGTGTTAMAARGLGRHGISVDYSADYCRLAAWRVDNGPDLAAVQGFNRKAFEQRDSDEPTLFDLAEEAS